MNRIPKVLCVSISYLSVAAVCISQGTGEFISFEAFPDGTAITDITTIYYEESLGDDPVAYYSFRGNADDQSGNGNHCVVNGPVLAEGIYRGLDGCYVFDGIDDYLDCGNGATINPTAALSIAAWMKPADLSGVRIVSKWGILAGYELDIVSGVVRMILNQSWLCTYDLSGSENRWVHLVSVWDGSNDVVLFVNGEAVCTGWFQGPLVPSPNNLLIGVMANLAPSSYFSGSIDEVRIYDRGLSEEEVTALYSRMFNDAFESGDTSWWSATVGEAP
jgi:hypothetical protein